MKKFIIYSLLVVIGLFAVYSTLCYFGSKELDIKVKKTIDAPALMIYNQVNDFNNWSNWSSWAQIDTSIRTEMGALTEGKGASYKWFTKKYGGAISIEESTKASSIKTKFTSTRNKNVTYADWTIKPLSNEKTVVEIHFYGEKEIPFFIRGYRLVTGVKYRIRKGLNNDLDNLEKLTVKQYKDHIYNGYKINLTTAEERYFIMHRAKVPKDKIQQFYNQNLGSLFKVLQDNRKEMANMPSGLYFSRSENEYDMAAAIPVREELAFDDVASYTIPAGDIIVVDYLGDYTGIDKAHKAIQQYMKDHNIYSNPPMIETYITDPAKEKDAVNWLTRVIYYYSH